MLIIICVAVCVALIGIIAVNTRAELRAVWMRFERDKYDELCLIGEFENTSRHWITIDYVACLWSHGVTTSTVDVDRAFTEEYEPVRAIAPHRCVPVLVDMDSLRPPGKLGKPVKLGVAYHVMGDPKQRATRAPAPPGY